MLEKQRNRQTSTRLGCNYRYCYFQILIFFFLCLNITITLSNLILYPRKTCYFRSKTNPLCIFPVGIPVQTHGLEIEALGVGNIFRLLPVVSLYFSLLHHLLLPLLACLLILLLLFEDNFALWWEIY